MSKPHIHFPLRLRAATGAAILAIVVLSAVSLDAQPVLSRETPIATATGLVSARAFSSCAIATDGQEMMAVTGGGEGLALVRIDREGKVVNPIGTRVSLPDTRSVAVAWNGHNYIVYAQHVRVTSSAPTGSAIYGVVWVVSQDGAIVAGPVDYGQVPSTRYSLAGNGKSVLLSISGQSHFIMADGRLDSKSIATPGENPLVVAAGTEFLVFNGTTYNVNHSLYDCWRVSDAGEVIAQGDQLVTEPAAQFGAAAAADRVLVAWTITDQPVSRQTRRRVFTALLDTAGHVLRSTQLLDETSENVSTWWGSATPTVAFDGRRFGVSWSVMGAESERRMLRQIDLDGSPAGEAAVLDPTGADLPAAATSTDSAHPALIWFQRRRTPSYAYPGISRLLYCRSFEDLQNGSEPLVMNAARQYGMSVVQSTAGLALVSWTEEVPSDGLDLTSSVKTALVDRTALPGGAIEVTTPGFYVGGTTILPGTDGYVLFFPPKMARRVSADGHPQDGPEFQIWTPEEPNARAWFGSNYWLAWTDYEHSLSVARLSDSGKTLDWPGRLLLQPDRSLDRYGLRFVQSPSALFLAWLDVPRGATAEFRIGRLGGDASLLASTSINVGNVTVNNGSSTATWLPQAAANDREILIAAKGINGACRHLWRMDPDLHLQGSGKDVLCNPADFGGHTRPVWDGRSWWLFYQSDTNPGIRAVPLNDDLTTDGQPILISDAADAALSTVTPVSGGLLIGYSRNVEELATRRLFLRYLSATPRRRAVMSR